VLVNATNPGVWAFHCHILTHAESDAGMFGMVTAFIIE
jgi:FtsP/CotA-like multicopper oxidase with cupredoxin domain